MRPSRVIPPAPEGATVQQRSATSGAQQPAAETANRMNVGGQ